MNMQFMIPSFNPSLSSSRKEKYSPYQPNIVNFRQDNNHINTNQNQFDFSKKLFEFDVTMPINSYEFNQNMNTQSQSEQFWEMLYGEQTHIYKNLMKKNKMLQQSISLHRQALSLRNSQSIDSIDRIGQINQRIRNLSKKSQNYDQKIKVISTRCHQKKSQIDQARSKVHKQQALIVQQQKHISELQLKVKRLKQQQNNTQKQLNQLIQKQNLYDNLVQENRNFIQQRNRLKNQATFAKLKINKDLQQQESIFKKMKELQKIIRAKQKNNRELGKKLVEFRRMNPEVIEMINQKNKTNNEKSQKLAQINKNIKDLQFQFSKIQQQTFQISQRIETTRQRMQQKIKSLQILRIKHQQEVKKQQKQKQKEQQRQKKVSNKEKNFELKNNQNIKRGMQSDPQILNYDNSGQVKMNSHSKNLGNVLTKKKPIIVIQSEQNQLFMYPRISQKNYTAQISNYNSIEQSQRGLERSKSRSKQKSRQKGREKQRSKQNQQNEYSQNNYEHTSSDKQKSYPLKVTYSQRQNLSDNLRSQSYHISHNIQSQNQNSDAQDSSSAQNLRYTQSFKNLLDRYKKIISNTHFKH